MTETQTSDAKPANESAAGTLPEAHVGRPAGILIGYARCSTERQDLTAQRQILRGLGLSRNGSISTMG